MRAALTASLLAATTMASPQQGVDFSGRWTLQSTVNSPDVARVLTIEQPVTRKNVRGDDMPPAYLSITIRRESDAGVDAETRHLSVIGGTVGARGSSRTETKWEGDTLVLFDGTYSGDPPKSGEWHERREEWSVGTNGLLTLVLTTDGSQAPRQTQWLVYVRQR